MNTRDLKSPGDRINSRGVNNEKLIKNSTKINS